MLYDRPLVCFFSGNTALCVVFERGQPVFIGVLCVLYWNLSNGIILSFWDSAHCDYLGFWDKPHRPIFECVLFAFLVVVILIILVSYRTCEIYQKAQIKDNKVNMS